MPVVSYASAQQHNRPAAGRVVRTIGSEFEEFEGEKFKNCHIVEYAGEVHVFSHRAILTLVVMASCNAACKFCSNEITFTPAGPYLRLDERLARVREFALTAGVTKVAFTGGEPTLQQQRLYDLVSSVVPGFARARLHTNGFGLFKNVVVDDDEMLLLPALIGAGLTGASVSVAHHDAATNRQIMQFKPNAARWEGMSEDDLREVATYTSDRFTPRLSCVMTHEGVNTVPDMLDYMAWGRSLGFRKFIFRTCSEIPQEFRKPTAFSQFNADNYLSVDDIAVELERLGTFQRTFRQRKSDSKVDVYRWGDVTFDVDESSEEVDPDRKIRRINVMPDGVAYTSWIDPLAVLFAEDRERAERSMRREFTLG